MYIDIKMHAQNKRLTVLKFLKFINSLNHFSFKKLEIVKLKIFLNQKGI